MGIESKWIVAFLEYLKVEKNYSEHTLKAYGRDVTSFEGFCLENFEGACLISVNYIQIRSWIVSLVQSGLSNRTINRKVSSLKTFYGFLRKIGEMNYDPLLKHKVLKTTKKISVPFTEKEVNHVMLLLKERTDFEGLRDRLMIELLYSTGIRRAELINMKESDVDFVNNTIKILGKRSKERLVILLPVVTTTLKDYLLEKKKMGFGHLNASLLVTSKGDKLYETFVYRIINSYFRRVSTKVKKSPHILRHAFATHLINNGAALNSVKELLGHSSLASTQVYTHNSLEEIKKVFNMAHPRESN